MRFTRRFSAVDALQYDGTPASSLAICAAFRGKVFRSIVHDDMLQVTTSFGYLEVRTGQWISREIETGSMRVWDDDDFHGAHEVLDPARAA